MLFKDFKQLDNRREYQLLQIKQPYVMRKCESQSYSLIMELWNRRSDRYGHKLGKTMSNWKWSSVSADYLDSILVEYNSRKEEIEQGLRWDGRER